MPLHACDTRSRDARSIVEAHPLALRNPRRCGPLARRRLAATRSTKRHTPFAPPPSFSPPPHFLEWPPCLPSPRRAPPALRRCARAAPPSWCALRWRRRRPSRRRQFTTRAAAEHVLSAPWSRRVPCAISRVLLARLRTSLFCARLWRALPRRICAVNRVSAVCWHCGRASRARAAVRRALRRGPTARREPRNRQALALCSHDARSGLPLCALALWRRSYSL